MTMSGVMTRRLLMRQGYAVCERCLGRRSHVARRSNAACSAELRLRVIACRHIISQAEVATLVTLKSNDAATYDRVVVVPGEPTAVSERPS